MTSNNSPIFKGIATALITPFCNGSVDFYSMARLIDIQLENNVSAIVVCGTTGEAPTLTDDEHTALIEFAVKRVNGAIPIIAGSGNNCTKKAIDLSLRAEAAGADALLIVTPYYNKASDDGLIKHYAAISDSVSIPIILYNVPSRTGVDISMNVYKALTGHNNIKGLKEARGNTDTVKAIAREGFPLQIFSGNDKGLCDMLEVGALGCISVASNIIPNEMMRLCNLYFAGKTEEAREIEKNLSSLFNMLFCEINPIPVKYAMNLLGLCDSEMRLPLCLPSAPAQKLIESTLKNYSLYK